jgi:CheY-like chemotaxis protein
LAKTIMSEQPPVVAAVADLMFASKIRGAAAQTGVEVVFARSAADLVDRAAGTRLILLDLETRWLDAATIRALKQGAARDAVVIAFASHVRGDLLTSARAAGADRVLARSAFVRTLPALLSGEG